MEYDNAEAVAILNAIADAHSALGELAVRLRGRPDVTQVIRALDCSAGPTLDFYTDAELTNGEAVSWGVEVVYIGDEWVIESSIRRNHRQGQDVIRELPTRYATSVDDFVGELHGAVEMAISIWSAGEPMFSGEGYGT